jgi:MFS family permease
VVFRDLVFILVSTPGSIFASHSHKLLILAPIIEGSLGGWSALQSAITAYISDCTSPGSRATVFSRFTGLFYVGFSLGPSIAGWVIRSGIGAPAGQKTVTAVFWLAIICSLINFILVLFVFPESLSKEKLARAKELYILERGKKGKARSAIVHDREGSEQGELATDADEPPAKGRSVIDGLLSPLTLFLPVTVTDSTGKASKDWSLTFLAMVLFAYYLSTARPSFKHWINTHFLEQGLYQIKYLFATHVFGWSVEQLGYYISFMGAVRASYLLIFLPCKFLTLSKDENAVNWHSDNLQVQAQTQDQQ